MTVGIAMAVTKNGGSGDDTPGRTDNADTLRGGSGDDTLYGRGADLLESASGSDRIFASSGRDDVYAGSSGDTFYADDGYRDYTDCDSGTDRVQRDNFDRVVDCEQRF